MEERDDLEALSQFSEALLTYSHSRVSAKDIAHIDIEKITDEFFRAFKISLEFLVKLKKIYEDDLNSYEIGLMNDIEEIELPLPNILKKKKMEPADKFCKVFIANLLVSDYVNKNIIHPERDMLIFAIKNIEEYCFSDNRYLKTK